MDHARSKLLPLPESLGARLAAFFLLLLFVDLVVSALALLDILKLSPVDMELTFSWVMLGAALLCMVLLAAFWAVVRREVLRPLERIRQEESGGLHQVAETVQELRHTVDRTQAELNESHRNLRQAAKLAMVGKLAAGVAHSVRNPLTSVKLRLFSLERGLAFTRKQEEDFKVIAQAIKHVDGIVGNFLEFSRRPIIRLQHISTADIVDGAMKLLENRVRDFPVSCSVKRPQKLPKVHADPDQMREALLNILLNACEAMEYCGNLEVAEFLRTDDEGALFVCIQVRDSGPGIPEETQKEIFTPFFSTKEQGTGLGLPIAKNIMEEHGGGLEVSSSARTGSLFTFLLPVQAQCPLPSNREDFDRNMSTGE